MNTDDVDELLRLHDALVLARRRVDRQMAMRRKVVPITPGSPWRNLRNATRDLKAYLAQHPPAD